MISKLEIGFQRTSEMDRRYVEFNLKTAAIIVSDKRNLCVMFFVEIEKMRFHEFFNSYA